MLNITEREVFFMRLYREVFPVLCRYISKRGGTLEDAKDVFQDSVIIYPEKLVAGLDRPLNEKAYLMGIAKHIWLKRFNAQQNVVNDEALLQQVEPENPQPDSGKLLSYLETAGKKCMELLKAFYYDQQPVQTITRLFGYSGPHSASVQKYKCLEKVRDQVKQQALSYEDFIK